MSDNAPSADELLTRALALMRSLTPISPERRSVIERLILDIEARQAFDGARKGAL